MGIRRSPFCNQIIRNKLSRKKLRYIKKYQSSWQSGKIYRKEKNVKMNKICLINSIIQLEKQIIDQWSVVPVIRSMRKLWKIYDNLTRKVIWNKNRTKFCNWISIKLTTPIRKIRKGKKGGGGLKSMISLTNAKDYECIKEHVFIWWNNPFHRFIQKVCCIRHGLQEGEKEIIKISLCLTWRYSNIVVKGSFNRRPPATACNNIWQQKWPIILRALQIETVNSHDWGED